jgi:hypothetical protein
MRIEILLFSGSPVACEISKPHFSVGDEVVCLTLRWSVSSLVLQTCVGAAGFCRYLRFQVPINFTNCLTFIEKADVTNTTRKRALKIFAAIVVTYVILTLPGYWWPEYLNSPLGILVLVPFFTVAIFHMIGIPHVLANDGLCGWGWCAPTVLGWVLSYSLWLVIIWLVSVGFSKLTAK